MLVSRVERKPSAHRGISGASVGSDLAAKGRVLMVACRTTPPTAAIMSVPIEVAFINGTVTSLRKSGGGGGASGEDGIATYSAGGCVGLSAATGKKVM